jgi:Universal stress protein family
MSPAYNPDTGFFYVAALEGCGINTKSFEKFRPGGFPFDATGYVESPDQPRQLYVRALDLITGKLQWEFKQVGSRAYGAGLLSTAGGLIFARLRPRHLKDLVDEAHFRLRELMGQAGIDAPHAVIDGTVADGVREEAVRRKADLIVTGRGRAQATFARIWSHVYPIVRESPCPVLSISAPEFSHRSLHCNPCRPEFNPASRR